ncbi:MAG: thioether cross-link-forming SCIFF peptide maturase [Clostridiales bacterium]|nr:thioether cross-link-forming SCIFF peptide maturase [Clostridiales bacterium]
MIHTYTLNRMHITVDAASCSVHVTDRQGMDAITLYEQGDRAQATAALKAKYPELSDADIADCLSDIDELRAQGKLYARDNYQSVLPSAPRQHVVKALCLHVAHVCNLACSYCFAGQGRYQGAQALMPYEVGRDALDFLVAHSGARRNLEVDFFGGEPLMNWDVVKRLVAYGRALEKKHNKVFRFTLTTNGMLLDDEVIDFCNREMHNVVLSLDGRREVHDRFRVDHKGRGSYDAVVPRFQEFVRRRGQKGYYMRGTFTHHNLDFVNDVLHMADLGFTQLSMEPVVTAPDDPSAITWEDLPQVFSGYERLALEMLTRHREGRPFDFYHYQVDLGHGPCIHKRVAGCGSGTEYLAVTPWGDLYPCHQFVGEEAYRLGSLKEGITNPALQASFGSCNVFAHQECQSCWAKYFCAGGCAANAAHATGRIDGVYAIGCALFKKRMECAIMLQAALQEAEEMQEVDAIPANNAQEVAISAHQM